MKTARLFISNLTQIDYAFIDPKTVMINGGSLNLDVEVTGKVDTQENVVVDFGTIKREIKELIDDPQRGFDHKLWVLPCHGSKGDALSWVKSNSSSKHFALYNHGNSVVVATPKLSIVCGRDAVRVCPFYSLYTLQEYMEEFLLKWLRIKGHNLDSISVYLRDTPILPFNHTSGSQKSFRYVHGLRDSTSWGCQNIAHGHLSWVIFLDGYSNFVFPSMDFQNKIDDEMNGTIFIWKDNIISEDQYSITFGYESGARGPFTMQLSKADCKYKVIDTETTVEHLVAWFCQYFDKEIKEMIDKGATEVYFSEGLVKGAYLRFKDLNTVVADAQQKV